MDRFHRLAHSIWDCKYHILWIPKYRRKELYGDKKRVVAETIKQWARIKGIEIIEGHAMPDHIHLCVSIPPKYSVAHTIGPVDRGWRVFPPGSRWFPVLRQIESCVENRRDP